MKKLIIAVGVVTTLLLAYSAHTGWDVVESIYNIGSDTGPHGPGTRSHAGLHHK